MLLLTSTSDVVQIITGSAVTSIVSHTSYVDNNAGTITPDRKNVAITTATTTSIVTSPASGVQRNVKMIDISNTDTVNACQVTVQHTDGTTVVTLFDCTLLPGEDLVLDATGSWHHHDIQGADYLYTAPSTANLGPTGTLAENMPRWAAGSSTTAGSSGSLYMAAIYLTAGQTVSNITIVSGGTAFGTPTNYFFALYSGSQSAPALLAQSANQTTTAWAGNVAKTLAMTTPYKVPTSGVYYVAVMMTATTMGTYNGPAALTNVTLIGMAPIPFAGSSAGLTTSLPNPAAALTSNPTAARFYTAVS